MGGKDCLKEKAESLHNISYQTLHWNPKIILQELFFPVGKAFEWDKTKLLSESRGSLLSIEFAAYFENCFKKSLSLRTRRNYLKTWIQRFAPIYYPTKAH